MNQADLNDLEHSRLLRIDLPTNLQVRITAWNELRAAVNNAHADVGGLVWDEIREPS